MRILVTLLLWVWTLSAASPLLWEAERGETRIYLLGSVHVGTPAMYPLHDAIQRAYGEADMLVMEVDLSQADRQMGELMQRYAPLPRGQSLKSLLPQATFRALQKQLAHTPYTLSGLDTMAPWYVALLITQHTLQASGLDPALGVDRHLSRRAAQDGLPVAELEGAAYQISLLATLPDDEQHLLLQSALEPPAQAEGFLKGMMKAWKQGDALALEGLIHSSWGDQAAAVSLQQTLLQTRNRHMLTRLEALSATHPDAVLLVVVGAGHMVGGDSLPDLLKERGWKLRRVTSP